MSPHKPITQHSTALHPREGARFLLDLQCSDENLATYNAAIFTPTEHFAYLVELSAHDPGQPRFTPLAKAAPNELEIWLKSLATIIARAARQRSAEGQRPFPPRIVRWRAPTT